MIGWTNRCFRVSWATCGLVLCAGCEIPKSGLALLSDQKEARVDARKRWDDMRGSARLQVAERHFVAGRYDETEKELDIIHAAAPNHAEPYRLAARLWLEKGELARARDAVTRAAALSDEPEIDFLAGIVAERYDDPALALQRYETASTNAPRVVDYLLARIEMLLTLGREIEALALAEAGIRDFDANVGLQTLAAQIHRALGLRSPTIERAREAVRLSDDEPSAVAELASSLVWAGRNVEAIELLRPIVPPAVVPKDSLEHSPQDRDQAEELPPADILLYLGRAYLQDKQPVEAMQVFRRLATERPTHTLAWSFYARAAVMAGELQSAAEALEIARVENPSAEVYLLSAFAACRLEDFEGTNEFARRVLEYDDRIIDAYCLLGQSAEAMGEVDQAYKAYADALAIDPQSELVRSLLHALAEYRRYYPIGPATDNEDSPRRPVGHTVSSGILEAP
ncbi:MAG: hypothetical protein O7B26_02915 [Planctomycetota bacterium]|nr:hypothetical protein [Planctomycetota bacterium]